MYKVYLDFGANKQEEKTFAHFNAVTVYLSSILFPPKRIHIIYLNKSSL